MVNADENNLLKQYHAMINAFDDAVFIVEKIDNGDYRFQVLNKKVADVIGMDRSKILGKTLVEIFEIQIAQKMKENYDRCISENGTIEYEEELLLSNRKSFWRTRLSPLFENNQVIGILGMSKNMTLQKNMKDIL